MSSGASQKAPTFNCDNASDAVGGIDEKTALSVTSTSHMHVLFTVRVQTWLPQLLFGDGKISRPVVGSLFH